MCATAVSRAVQKALGKPQGPTGYQSAKDQGPYYQSLGFNQIQTNSFQNGDIVIFTSSVNPSGKSYPHGHVQIYCNGTWVSDFIQKKFSPYSQHTPSYKVYRYGGWNKKNDKSSKKQTYIIIHNNFI